MFMHLSTAQRLVASVMLNRSSMVNEHQHDTPENASNWYLCEYVGCLCVLIKNLLASLQPLLACIKATQTIMISLVLIMEIYYYFISTAIAVGTVENVDRDNCLSTAMILMLPSLAGAWDRIYFHLQIQNVLCFFFLINSVLDTGVPVVHSGVKDMKVLKTTQSGFEGFFRDRFTTLQDTKDRVFCTNVYSRWRYNKVQDVDFDAAW